MHSASDNLQTWLACPERNRINSGSPHFTFSSQCECPPILHFLLTVFQILPSPYTQKEKKKKNNLKNCLGEARDVQDETQAAPLPCQALL